MENPIKNLENLSLDGWNLDIDFDMTSVIESSVRGFLTYTDIEVWFPDDIKHGMDAKITLMAQPDVCDKGNPFIEINMTEILTEQIKDIHDYGREGDITAKKSMSDMRADLITMVSLIDELESK